MNNNDIVPGFDDEKDDSLKIRLQKVDSVDNCLTLFLTGYIDTYNSNFFQKRVGKAIEAGFIRLIFNCGGLNYVSSTGIGSFTAFLKAVKPRGGDIVLLEIQPKVYEVFQLLGFSQFFNIKDNGMRRWLSSSRATRARPLPSSRRYFLAPSAIKSSRRRSPAGFAVRNAKRSSRSTTPGRCSSDSIPFSS